MPAPLEPIGRQALPSKYAISSAVATPLAFWNDPAAKTSDPDVVSALMNVVVVNQPSVPAVFEPTALHAEPSHFTTWSAAAIPATFVASVPT